MSKKHDPKPATHLDPVPKTAATDSPLHSTDNLESNPGDPNPGLAPRTALDRERADQTEPEIAPAQPASVPVPDPDPQAEPHYPSGADEIMRRHRLVAPEVAKAKTEDTEEESPS